MYLKSYLLNTFIFVSSHSFCDLNGCITRPMGTISTWRGTISNMMLPQEPHHKTGSSSIWTSRSMGRPILLHRWSPAIVDYKSYQHLMIVSETDDVYNWVVAFVFFGWRTCFVFVNKELIEWQSVARNLCLQLILFLGVKGVGFACDVGNAILENLGCQVQMNVCRSDKYFNDRIFKDILEI